MEMSCEWKYRCKFEYAKPIVAVASPQCATRACLPVYAILTENSRIFAYSLWNKLTPETNNTSRLTPIFRHTHILMTKYDIESSRRRWDERRWRQSEVDVWSLLVQTAAVSAGLPMLCTCSLQTHTQTSLWWWEISQNSCVYELLIKIQLTVIYEEYSSISMNSLLPTVLKDTPRTWKVKPTTRRCQKHGNILCWRLMYM